MRSGNPPCSCGGVFRSRILSKSRLGRASGSSSVRGGPPFSSHRPIRAPHPHGSRVRSPSKGLLGFPWLSRVLLASPREKRTVLEPQGFPGLSSALLASPGLSWALLGSPRLFCALLGFPGLCWALMGSPGLPWAPLSSPGLSSHGLYTALLGSPGLFWALLGSPGLSWALLGSPGLSWALIGHVSMILMRNCNGNCP